MNYPVFDLLIFPIIGFEILLARLVNDTTLSLAANEIGSKFTTSISGNGTSKMLEEELKQDYFYDDPQSFELIHVFLVSCNVSILIH